MCCQPLCFIFFFLPPRPLYPGKAFWGSGGWLRRGETEEWSTKDPRVMGVEAGRFVAPVPPDDEVEPNWFVNVEPSGTERWDSNLFSFLRWEVEGVGGIRRNGLDYAHTTSHTSSLGFNDISSSFSLTYSPFVGDIYSNPACRFHHPLPTLPPPPSPIPVNKDRNRRRHRACRAGDPPQPKREDTHIF